MHFVALIHHVHPHDYSCKRDMQERVVAKGGEQGVKYMWLALVGSGSHSLCSLGLSLLKGVYVNKVVMPFLSFPFLLIPFAHILQTLFLPLTKKNPSFPPIQHRQLQASTPYNASTSMMCCAFGLVINVVHSVTKKAWNGIDDRHLYFSWRGMTKTAFCPSVSLFMHKCALVSI